MNIRSLALVAALSSSSVVMGCGGGPQWIVHSQANPDPFLNQHNFAVVPTDYTGYMVGGKSEADYLSDKKPDQQASYQADKQGIDEMLVNALAGKSAGAGIQISRATGPEAAPFQIHPVVQWLEPGYYVGISAAPAELRVLVRFTSPDGKVLDEIEVHKKAKGLATGQRLRMAAEQVGNATAAYLATRVNGGAK
jgi:hypothetical protein